jgi:hypothetical protein
VHGRMDVKDIIIILFGHSSIRYHHIIAIIISEFDESENPLIRIDIEDFFFVCERHKGADIIQVCRVKGDANKVGCVNVNWKTGNEQCAPRELWLCCIYDVTSFCDNNLYFLSIQLNAISS